MRRKLGLLLSTLTCLSICVFSYSSNADTSPNVEAESGYLLSSVQIGNDSKASGGQYVYDTPGTGRFIDNHIVGPTSNTEAIAALIAALLAAITSFTVAYLSIRTQRQIARFQGKVEKNNKRLMHELEQQRDFDSFRRDRISSHLDSITQSYQELSTVAHIVRLRWWHDLANSKDIEAWFIKYETRFYTHINLVIIHVSGLEAFGVISKEVKDPIMLQIDDCKSAWSLAIGTFAYKETDLYKKENPDEKAIDSSITFNGYLDLECKVHKLGDLVMPLANSLKRVKSQESA